MAHAQFKQEKWSLSDLYPGIDSSELERGRKKLDELARDFEGRRAGLVIDMSDDDFLEALIAYERLIRLLNRVIGYGQLKFSEDTQDSKGQTFLAQSQQLAAEIDNRSMFFSLWWKGLEDDVADRLLAGAGDYRYWLEVLRLHRPHTLSEAEEKVINLKDVNGPVALRTLYDSITNRYVFRLKVGQEVKELTRSELTTYVQGSDPDLREAAYKELFRVYEGDAPTLGMIYQYRVRDWRSENLGLRNYSSPISVRNLANDIADEVVEILLDVCQQNAPLFQRYFRLKASVLGVPRLRRYDIYAPVIDRTVEIAYDEGVGLVLESFDRFEPQVAKLAQKVFEERHIDSEVRKGKRSGASCSTLGPDLTPWVLTNYNNQARDVATLAHELGHAVHSLLASDHTALTQQATLPLAETASTFGEMLLVDHLLERDPDPDLQRDLLFRQMDDAYATIIRQAYFALFEREAHDLIQGGGSVVQLSDLYYGTLQDQFGESLDLSEDFRSEWLAIPHIYHAPFYVYAYAFGQLLVLSLYQQYRQEGDPFKPRYIAILSAGSSASPDHILTKAGIDIRSTDFWQGGFDVIRDSLERLEALEASSG